MKIGIDGSRAFQKNRTGIEEYSYQVVRHLREELGSEEVFLYLRKNQAVDFSLPKNWKVKVIRLPYLWTQLGLSLRMLFDPVDVLFIPAHTVPLIHPRKTIVVVHGLEYETYPAGYSFLERLYMRFTIKFSCRAAKKIIAVSKNTKKDLLELYKVPEEKIEVAYEGIFTNIQITNISEKMSKYKPFLLFIGRLEKRKNIEGIVSAFEILKEKYKIPHKLVLAGKPGYWYENIKLQISNSKWRKDILEVGYVSEEEKYDLLKSADIFLFPSFYEGFGLPVLEAQSFGAPVVISNVSSLPEVGGGAAAYCDPDESITIADAAHKILNEEEYRDSLVKKGYENVEKFSWEKCVREITGLLIKK